MTAQQLRCFIMAAEHGSISAAAKAMGLSQSAVSSAIARLEEEWGFPLFVRTHRTILLTEEGKESFAEARKLMQHFYDTESRLRELGSELLPMKIGATPATGFSVLLPIIEEYRKLYPNARINVKEGGTMEMQKQLAEDELDLTLALLDEPESTAFECQVLKETCVALIMNKKNPLAGKQGITTDMLEGKKLVLAADSSYTTTRVVEERLQESGVNADIFARCNQMIFACLFVRADASMLASTIREVGYIDANITAVPLEPLVPKYIVLLWKKERSLPTEAVRFISFVRNLKEIPTLTLTPANKPGETQNH